MKKVLWNQSLTLAFLALTLLPAAGCQGESDESSSSSSTSSVSNPPVGVVDDSAGFYVQHQASANYTYLTHKGSTLTSAGSFTYTTKCTAVAGEDIMCYVEGDELDMYFWGTTLQYNVPSNMCSYFLFEPPYYYRLPAGYGPTTARYNVTTSTGAITDQQNSEYGTAVCQYDYSKLTPPGPNCCQGSYVLSAGADGVYTSSSAKWGGKIGDCLSGTATATEPKSSSGFPRPTLYYVAGSGLNQVYTNNAPINIPLGSNAYIADYFTSTDFEDSSTWPNAFSGLNVTPSGTTATGATITTHTPSPYETTPYYILTCYDRAHEVKSRIRLMIRAWDKEGMKGVLTSYSGTAGNEPTYGEPYHDFYNWDDISALGSGWTLGFPLFWE